MGKQTRMGPPGFNAQISLYQSQYNYPAKAVLDTRVPRRISSIFHESGHQFASILR